MEKDFGEETRNKKSKMIQEHQPKTSVEGLPHDIVLNILSRLRVTSLIHARMVCRAWHSTARDPLLAAMHFSRAAENDPGLILHCNFPIQNQLYFVHFDARVGDPETVRRILTPTLPEFNVLGSCNGLICLCDSRHKNAIYVYNPFIRNHIELPKAEQLSPQEEVAFGFGFHPRTKEYKVVRIVYYRNKDGSNPNSGSYSLPHSEVQVLTLGSSGWRSVGQATHQLQRKPSRAFVNGRLHWLTCKHRHQPLREIVSYDLADDQFRKVLRPKSACFGRRCSDLVILQGCLSAAVYTGLTLDVWILKEYDAEESWVRELCIGVRVPNDLMQIADQSFTISKFFVKTQRTRVLCLMRNGDILLECKCRALVSYDPKFGTFKELMFRGLPTWFESNVHVGSINWIETAIV